MTRISCQSRTNKSSLSFQPILSLSTGYVKIANTLFKRQGILGDMLHMTIISFLMPPYIYRLLGFLNDERKWNV